MRFSPFLRAARLRFLATCLLALWALPAAAASAPAAIPCPDPAATGMPPMTWPMGLVPPDRELRMPGFGIKILQKYSNYFCRWSNPLPGHENDKYHEALDLVEDVDPEGPGDVPASSVYAAWPGEVLCVQDSGSLPEYRGHAVILRHATDAGDLFTTYHHLDEAAKTYWSSRIGEQVEQGRWLGQLIQSTEDYHDRHLHFVVRTSLGSNDCLIGWGYQPEPVTPATGYCNPLEFLAKTQTAGGATLLEGAEPVYASSSTSSEQVGEAAPGSVYRVLANDFLGEEADGEIVERTTDPATCIVPDENDEIFRHWQQVESFTGETWNTGWISRAVTLDWRGDSRGGAFRGVELEEPESHQWYFDEPQTLRWVAGGVDAVDLRLVSVPPGTAVQLAQDVPAADQQYQIVVPAVAKGTYLIEITDAAGGGEVDTSENIDIGPPGIAVLAPVAGVTWFRGSTYNVTWLSGGVTGNVKIELLSSLPGAIPIVASTPDDGSYAWTVSPSLDPGPRFLRICNLDATVCSPNVPFNLATPGITVFTPAAGAICYKTATCQVTWLAHGNENLKLELYSGSTLIQGIVPSTPDDGVHDWIVPPQLANGSYRVKVTLLSGLASGYSPIFEVQALPAITITSPAAGATWRKGSPYTITWTWENVPSTVHIDLLQNGGLVQRLASATTNDGQHGWTPPTSLASGGYQLKICQTTGTPCGSVAFTIASPTVAITQPTAGAFWQRGTTKTITWQAPGVTETINIELLVSGSWIPVAMGTPNDGAQSWTIPSNLGGSYPLRICTASAAACATVSFNISWLQVNQPVGSEVWYVGNPESVAWSSGGLGGSLKLEILAGGAVVHTIAGTTPNDGSEPLTVPPLGGGSAYQVRVCHLASGICASSAAFTIVTPTITVADPAGPWYHGTSHTIGWWAPGITEQVKIELMDGGPVYTVNAGMANTGSFAWTVPPSILPSSYTLRVCTLSLSACDSSASFLIAAPPSLMVQVPFGGASWYRGMSYDILWTSTGLTGNVKIELMNGGAVEQTISAGTANDSSYTWSIPGSGPTGPRQIRICQVGGGLCDSSDTFNLLSPITVTSPTSSSQWTIGSSQTIGWTSAPVTDGVRLTLREGPTEHYVIAESTPNDGSQAWTVSGNVAAGSYYVRACLLTTGVCDDSDYFTISEPPPPALPTWITVTGTGGSYWTPGTSCVVQWSTDSQGGNVRVRLDKVGSGTSYTLAALTPNDLLLTNCVVPPNPPAGTYRVFVQSIENPGVSDYSTNIYIVY